MGNGNEIAPMGLGINGNPQNPPPLDNAVGGNNYLMVIGIDEYQDADKKLQSCINDCTAIKSILEQKYFFTCLEEVYDAAATKAGILKAFGNLRKRSFSEADSLIVYYSGHGKLFELNSATVNGRKVIIEGIGCWVPQDIPDQELTSYVKMSEIIDELRQAPLNKLRHILVISDCCHSGAILEEPGFYNFNTKGGQPGEAYDLAPSRWAICSGRSNEESVAGAKGKQSRFTSVFTKILQKNAIERLLLSKLIAETEEEFLTNKWQKPISDRLPIINNNAGQYIFTAKKDLAAIAKREQILVKHLMNLNYKNQVGSFDGFKENVKKQFAIFSGTPHCGLRHLSFKARKSGGFKGRLVKPLPVKPFSVTGMGDEQILNMFNLAMKRKYADINKLADDLCSMLTINSLVFEFYFYSETTGEEQVLRPSDKKKLLENLAAFVKRVNNSYPDDHRLYCFIIDQERVAYDALFNAKEVAGIHTIFAPLVSQLENGEAKNWYDQMRNTFLDSDKELDEFDVLFASMAGDQMETLVSQTNGFPGSVIQRICENAECAGLAEEILNPKK